MSKVPRLRHREIVKAFQRAGWDAEEGTRHTLLSKAGNPHILTIPRHPGDIAHGIVLSLIKTAGMTRQEFLDLL
jgi:predicted RNA binding protein YcfA (HicA-like mRNA interferase family)